MSSLGYEAAQVIERDGVNREFTFLSLILCILSLPLDALFILTSTVKQRFEFIFTYYGTNSTRFSPVYDIYKSYQSTTLYRELKLRGAILTDRQLAILPREQVYKQLNGVYNLSSDQGNLGLLCITNIRMVWWADSNESFNISLPYMQVSISRPCGGRVESFVNINRFYCRW